MHRQGCPGWHSPRPRQVTRVPLSPARGSHSPAAKGRGPATPSPRPAERRRPSVPSALHLLGPGLGRLPGQAALTPPPLPLRLLRAGTHCPCPPAGSSGRADTGTRHLQTRGHRTPGTVTPHPRRGVRATSRTNQRSQQHRSPNCLYQHLREKSPSPSEMLTAFTTFPLTFPPLFY